MAQYIGFLIGALIPTFLLSRLALWLMKSWDGGIQRIGIANGISLVVASLVGGMGIADGGAFAPLEAASRYILPQFVWFGVDLFILLRKT